MRLVHSSFFAFLLVSLATAARADSAADVEAASRAYKVDVTPSLHLKVGETGQFKVTVIPNAGDHVSPDAPISLTAVPATQFELPHAKLLRADSVATAAQGAQFSLPVTGLARGKGELKSTLVFFICVENLCAHQKRELSIPVEVD